MKNILLVLSTTRQSPKTIELALERAMNEGARLTGLFILDSNIADSIFEKLTDSGFIGDKPSQQLHSSILLEYRQRGMVKLEETKEMAAKKGVSFEAIIKEGDFFNECLEEINKSKADLVILTRKKRSSLSRFIFGSYVENIKKGVDCEVLIVDE
ncbi:MAG: universal stress protein [Proteobacteria bacterium]|nr:universal stress protein [Pseudomonadota bacterium]